jgi:hypothetical protein
MKEVDVIRTALVSAALIATSLAAAAAHAAVPICQAPAPAQVTAADAAPFLGDWTLDLQGANGPAMFNLSVKVENDKVVGEIGNDATETQKITSISKTDKSLVLNYSFPYEGNMIDAVVSLTPGTDGNMAAQIDFASGAYTVTGPATKKDKAK